MLEFRCLKFNLFKTVARYCNRGLLIIGPARHRYMNGSDYALLLDFKKVLLPLERSIFAAKEFTEHNTQSRSKSLVVLLTSDRVKN